MVGLKLEWKRWNRVDDSLRIALETTLPDGVEPEYVEGVEVPPVDVLETDKMIYRAKVVEKFNLLAIHAGQGGKETVDRHYHPSFGSGVNLRSATRQVNFKFCIKNGLFERVCLHRHRGGKKFVAMMFCGRAKELKPENQSKSFGFNSQRSANQDYVSLSYPGEDGKFEPLFIKVADAGLSAPYYLRVDAVDCEGGIVRVVVKIVSVTEVPAFLRGQH